MHKTFSIAYLHFISAYSQPLLECKCDRSLIVPFRQLCSLHLFSLLVGRQNTKIRIVYLDHGEIRSFKLSREKEVFFLFNNNCINNRKGKEQWGIRRFDLEFTTTRVKGEFRSRPPCIPRERDSFPRYNNAPCPSQLRLVSHSNDTANFLSLFPRETSSSRVNVSQPPSFPSRPNVR